jgi:hypothetical protein
MEALTSIAAQDVLPTQLGKIDPAKPPSWLADAAIAVGADATATAVDFLIRQDCGMRDPVLGGRSTLLHNFNWPHTLAHVYFFTCLAVWLSGSTCVARNLDSRGHLTLIAPL